MEQHWLTIVIVLLIVGILFDGVRRMRNARRDSLKMSLRPAPEDGGEQEDVDVYGSEFPNGGARLSDKRIDPERIEKARSRYDFGAVAQWGKQEWDKHQRGKHQRGKQERDRVKTAAETAPPPDRIEPYLAEPDPLLDQPSPQPVSGAVPPPVAAQPTPTEGRPVQGRLNLEETVPMVMETAEENPPADDPPHTHAASSDAATVTQRTDSDDDERILPVGATIDPHADEDWETRSANKPRYESKYTNPAQHAPLQVKEQGAGPQEVLVIHVRAPQDGVFLGSDLLALILEQGLRFGDMAIFHRHMGAEGDGPILYSMANMVKPGTFDLHTFETFDTVGLSFFLTLPTAAESDMAVFDSMLATAQHIADALSGELNDENRSVLTGQTIEHYRERIRDFARRQQLEKNK